MNHVLIVDDDEALRETLARAATRWGFEASVADSTAAALDVLRNRQVDVLVTDLRMDGPDGIDLIRSAVDTSPKTQTVLMSAYATAREQQLATGYGAVRVLCKPFTPEDLQKAIREALDSRKGYRGMVHGLSLIDMLQMFHLSRRTMSLVIGGERPGEVHFVDGNLVHATCGELTGLDAFKALLSGESGSIATSSPIDVPTTITCSFDALLMDALRELDEEQRREVSIAPVALDFDSAFTSQPPVPRISFAPVPSFESLRAPTLNEPVTSAKKSGGVQASAGDHNTRAMEQVCEKISAQVGCALACGVVDIRSGILLAVASSVSSLEFYEYLGDACASLLANSFASRLDTEKEMDGVQEIYITTPHHLYFMKSLESLKAAVVMITTKQISLAMGWASVRSLISEIEPLVP